MGSRYLISGVQLGLLVLNSRDKRENLIKEIVDEQFVGDSLNPIKEDVIKTEALF